MHAIAVSGARETWGSRVASASNHLGFFFPREAGLDMQFIHDGSQQSMHPVPRDPTPLSCLHRHQAHTRGIHTHTGETFIHIK